MTAYLVFSANFEAWLSDILDERRRLGVPVLVAYLRIDDVDHSWRYEEFPKEKDARCVLPRRTRYTGWTAILSKG